ncbi:uncharacterized protein LOC111252099 isoform X3 [Varroa destructor]|nr:uncharacterized protein LOC111252099 isoform X3 [Varroa destructor]XP_022665262.1 uncharacterized protein LOC111252099 isoform X3 [Varroa destructor]
MADYVSGGVADIQHKICRTTAVTNSDTESGELIREPRLVIGVKFIADLARWSQDHQHGVTILGSILLDKQDEQMPGDEVRRALLCQLPEAPVRFLFLSHDGSPIKKRQECYVTLRCLIAENRSLHLVRQYEKQKVGVRSPQDRKFGYIFVENNLMLKQVRNLLWEQLLSELPKGQDVPSGPHCFDFLDSNGYPIVAKQEVLFTVLDIVNDYTITIHTVTRGSDDQVDYRARAEQPTELKEIPHLTVPRRPNALDLPRSMNRNKNGLIHQQPEGKWEILISYARKDTEEHALQLKEELTKKNLKVFLDVHEINGADDWADSLNNAIKNCKFFVPLVSPLYGITKWTNREVKMADKLEKKILPVSFVDNWPPDCLAIQLATIQYIHAYQGHTDYHDDEGYSEDLPKHDDIPCSPLHTGTKKWDPRHVKRVADNIYKIFKAECDKERKNNMRKSVKRISSMKPTSNRTSWMLQTPVEEFASFPTVIEDKEYQEAVLNEKSISSKKWNKTSTEKIDVVISAHPRDKQTADYVMKILKSRNHSVWSTTDMDNDLSKTGVVTSPTGDVSSGLSNPAFSPSQRNLVEIPETPGQTGDNNASSEYHPPTNRVGSISCDLAGHRIAQISHFLKKASQTTIIVFIISRDFLNSSVSMQQVYYCQKRKHTIVIKTENCKDMPCRWDSLMGAECIDIKRSDFKSVLEERVKNELKKPDPSSDNETEEKNICERWEFELKKMPSHDGCVYISGSTKDIDDRTASICDEVGKKLAQVSSITLLTGGFNGVPQLVARSFVEARKGSKTDSVYHLLPKKDSSRFQDDAPQSSDGTFRDAELGKTVYIGDSIKERELIVGRTFSICILIGGDARAAHEAEQFLWNDHFVIPIISTGGAAGGDHNLDAKILQSPHCVHEDKWNVLKDPSVDPEVLANVVIEIWDRLHTQMIAIGRRPVRLLRHRPLPVKKRRRSRPAEPDIAEGSVESPVPFMIPADEDGITSHDGSYRPTGPIRIKWMRALNLFNRFTTHL